MFTYSDLVVLIMLAGSGILIWIARRSNSIYQKDVSRADHQDNPPSAVHVETRGGTGSANGDVQREKKDAPATEG